jgi:hypothetical protein
MWETDAHEGSSSPPLRCGQLHAEASWSAKTRVRVVCVVVPQARTCVRDVL